MNFDQIIQKIKEHKKLHHDWEVAILLGLSRTAFAERKRRNSIPQDKLKVFCEQEFINMKWLCENEGPKYRELKPAEGFVKEPETLYNNERLSVLVEKVAKIYKEGDLSERAAIRGMIDEVYDKMIEKIEKRLKDAIAEPKSELKKINHAG